MFLVENLKINIFILSILIVLILFVNVDHKE